MAAGLIDKINRDVNVDDVSELTNTFEDYHRKVNGKNSPPVKNIQIMNKPPPKKDLAVEPLSPIQEVLLSMQAALSSNSQSMKSLKSPQSS